MLKNLFCIAVLSAGVVFLTNGMVTLKDITVESDLVEGGELDAGRIELLFDSSPSLLDEKKTMNDGVFEHVFHFLSADASKKMCNSKPRVLSENNDRGREYSMHIECVSDEHDQNGVNVVFTYDPQEFRVALHIGEDGRVIFRIHDHEDMRKLEDHSILRTALSTIPLYHTNIC